MSYQTTNNVSIAANEVFGALKEKAQLASVFFTDVERSIVKATNRDLVVPKQKHVAIMLSCTYDSSTNIAQLFKILDQRIKGEKNWIVAFKSLLCIHYFLRDGNSQKVLAYLTRDSLGILNLSGFRDNASGGQGMEQSRNLKGYAAYLEERVAAARDLGKDYLRQNDVEYGHNRRYSSEDAYGGGGSTSRSGGQNQTSVNKNSLVDRKFPDNKKAIQDLLRVLESLTIAKPYTDSINNEITDEAFKLMTADLTVLFVLLNEAVVELLKQFFALEKADAVSALEIYEKFATVTEACLEWFSVAKRIQIGQVPDISHAPLSLAKTLREYISSPDFEQNRLDRIQKQNSPIKGNKSGEQQLTKSRSGIVDVFSANANNNVMSNNSAQQLSNAQPEVDLFAIAAPNGLSPSPSQQLQSSSAANAGISRNQSTDLFGFSPNNQQPQLQQQPQQSQQMMQDGRAVAILNPQQAVAPVGRISELQDLFGAPQGAVAMQSSGSNNQLTNFQLQQQQSSASFASSTVGPLPQQGNPNYGRYPLSGNQSVQQGSYSAPQMMAMQNQQYSQQSQMMERGSSAAAFGSSSNSQLPNMSQNQQLQFQQSQQMSRQSSSMFTQGGPQYGGQMVQPGMSTPGQTRPQAPFSASMPMMGSQYQSQPQQQQQYYNGSGPALNQQQGGQFGQQGPNYIAVNNPGFPGGFPGGPQSQQQFGMNQFGGQQNQNAQMFTAPNNQRQWQQQPQQSNYNNPFSSAQGNGMGQQQQRPSVNNDSLI
ncbi:hypothetical protein MIR68_003046 [Amoeboaphelidium protococcarum]|nr:hypothetical protein MIR68_003046 [Amoeboaphelidium protococcarum]